MVKGFLLATKFLVVIRNETLRETSSDDELFSLLA